MHFRDWSGMYKHNSNFILRRFYEVYKAAAVYHVQLKTHILKSCSLPGAVLEDAIVEATCA